MPRQVLPLVDFRTQAQRQGITSTQQTVQAISGILQTLGAAEQKRRDRLMLDRITRAISGGATTVEAIAAITREDAQLSKGIPGILQRIGGAFQPGGGAGQGIQQAIIGGALQRALTPKAPKLGTIPGWWSYATEKQKQDYMNRVGGPLVQVGQKLLTPEQRQAMADKGFEETMAETPLTTTQITNYGKAMDTRLDKSKRHWLMQPGRINYPESELFKQWQIFANMHKFKNDTQREAIWAIWQNKVKNRAAEGWFGKETDFDPTDSKWRKAIGLSPEVSGVPATPTEEGRVMVRDKQGKKYTVPREQLQDALDQGYELTEE